MIHSRDKKLTPPPPENKKDSHLNETALQNKNLWNGVLERCVLPVNYESTKEQSKARRLFLKFLLLAPPAFLFKIKLQSPFQNLNVNSLLNEAYGHTYTSSSSCGPSGGHWHDSICIQWADTPGGPDKGGATCKTYSCQNQLP